MRAEQARARPARGGEVSCAARARGGALALLHLYRLPQARTGRGDLPSFRATAAGGGTKILIINILIINI